MKNVLLLSNKLFHYRVPIYNFFKYEYNKEGFDFFVLTDQVQENFDHKMDFTCVVEKPNFFKYKQHIERINPAAVIVFLHLKDWIMWPVIHWLKMKGIPIIYWNHGVNLQQPDNLFKNTLYYYLHNLSDSIVLYSPVEKKYIKEKNLPKTYIGNNTLNFYSFPKISESKEELRKELNITAKKVAIFAASTTLRRRIELLLDVFKDLDHNEYCLLLLGLKNLEDDIKEVVMNTPSIKYIGEVPDQKKFNKFVKLSDVFTIPGRSGLAINQSFYWGVPYVTTNVKQSPEVWYLKNGFNGFITDIQNPSEYKEKLLELLDNDKLRDEMSSNAKKTISTEGSIENMYKGFKDAVNYVVYKKKVKV
jgi:glycosyltransferase involved in cell wall biosynthesis